MKLSNPLPITRGHVTIGTTIGISAAATGEVIQAIEDTAHVHLSGAQTWCLAIPITLGLSLLVLAFPFLQVLIGGGSGGGNGGSSSDNGAAGAPPAVNTNVTPTSSN